MEHICAQCLNTLAVWDRVARAELVCMCPACIGSVPPEDPVCPASPGSKDGDPFDWL